MSEHVPSDHSPQPESDAADQEMLDAIAAAFGDDAVAELASESLAEEQPDLNDLVHELDSAFASETSDLAPAENPTGEVNDATRKHVLIKIGDSVFGLPMENVHEIQRVPRITLLPGVPDWVMGVTNVRGNVVSVSRLNMLLGLNESTESNARSHRLVMTQSLIDDIETGFLVERVLGIRAIADNTIQPPTAGVSSQVARYLSGVAETDEHLVGLLDIDQLLLSEDFRKFETA